MLHLNDLHKTFNPGTVNEKVALNGVSLQMEAGDFATIVGSNGAGKSTLFNAITGGFIADEGSILLGGSLSSLNTLDELGFFYDGAGIDICDINKNGTPDLLMMVYDAPEGENSFRYQIAFDLQSNGNYLSLSPVYEVPGLGHDGDGAGVAVGDIDNNGTLDILFMALDAPSGKDKFVYEILPDIDKYGNSYAKPIYTPRFPDSLSPCDTGQGAACCLYDLDNNGFLDAIFVAIENIKGKSNSWKYVTGHNLNKQGVPMCWR